MQGNRNHILYSLFMILTLLLGCQTDEELKEIREEDYSGRVIGVSENVVVIDDEDENVESEDYDIQTGEYSVTFQDSIPPIATGSVIVIDRDTTGYLRMVNSITVDGNTIQMSTEQATFEDVFYDSEFKLSTEMVEAQTPSGGRIFSAKEMSTALTDEAGFIHPLEMHIHKANGGSQRISSFEGSGEGIGKGLYKYYDFSQTDIINENGVRLYVDEGYFEFDPVIKLEFEFDRQVDNLSDIVKGKISRFSFYSDNSKVEFKSILKCEASSYEKITELTLKNNLIRVTFKFLVAGVPVWITVDSDLLTKNQFIINGEATASTGIKSTRLITCGALYENSEWQPIHNYTKLDTIYPLEVQAGNTNIYDRFEIYPNTKILFYGVIGPNFDIVPYLTGEMNSSINLNRDLSLNAGVDARVGAEVTILGYDLLSWKSDNIRFFDTLLWYSPKTITIMDGNNQTGKTNSTLPVPIKVKVTDSKGLASPFIPVYFESTTGNGSVDQSKVFTDINGFAETNWTLGDIEGEQILEVFLRNANDEIMESQVNFTALAEQSDDSFSGDSGTFIDERDGEEYKWVQIGEQIWMAENLNYQGGWCYNEAEANCEIYGKLYRWFAAKNICPEGWHLPTRSEWTELIDFNGGASIAGGRLKSFEFWDIPNEGATSESMFNALPAGWLNSLQWKYYSLGELTIFWTSTEASDFQGIKMAYYHRLDYDSESINLNGSLDQRAYVSVRCILDE